jgi:dihydrofolate reductase
LSADLKLFKSLTMGHHLLMGRRTYDSIGRVLPGRRMIVLTRNRELAAPGCVLAGSLDEALRLAEKNGEEELFIIGGGQVFEEALPLAQQIYLTRVQAKVDCDVFFPAVNWEEWVEIERSDQPADAKNEFAFEFSRLVRKNNP